MYLSLQFSIAATFLFRQKAHYDVLVKIRDQALGFLLFNHNWNKLKKKKTNGGWITGKQEFNAPIPYILTIPKNSSCNSRSFSSRADLADFLQIELFPFVTKTKKQKPHSQQPQFWLDQLNNSENIATFTPEGISLSLCFFKLLSPVRHLGGKTDLGYDKNGVFDWKSLGRRMAIKSCNRNRTLAVVGLISQWFFRMVKNLVPKTCFPNEMDWNIQFANLQISMVSCPALHTSFPRDLPKTWVAHNQPGCRLQTVLSPNSKCQARSQLWIPAKRHLWRSGKKYGQKVWQPLKTTTDLQSGNPKWSPILDKVRDMTGMTPLKEIRKDKESAESVWQSAVLIGTLDVEWSLPKSLCKDRLLITCANFASVRAQMNFHFLVFLDLFRKNVRICAK